MANNDHYIILIAHFCALMMFTLPLTLHVTIDLPPPKRRKTLGGSIVSTALSAALIGTAVGLTVYRLWKGKGKESEAPPPYEQGEWVHPPCQEEAKKAGPHYIPQPEFSPQPETNNLTSPSMRSRRPRHVAGRRTTQRHRKLPARNTHAHDFNPSPPPHTQLAVQPQFNFGVSTADEDDEQDPDVSDQMDWMGDRLAQLIEEGKKALGKEIVVMSETKEDEEDDGSGQWEDDMPVASSSSASFHKSRSQRRRSSSVSSPPLGYLSPQNLPHTPQKNRFDPYSRPSSAFGSPGNRSRRDSVDSARSFAPIKEDESTWESAELRESMEKARQAYLQRKQQMS
ncbi:hypothetical protein PHLGIDRAFT_37433 [Phlebiopsis gigantea 11061_1 CR5-6]|uniref:Uncharacterized protein n=1 Tax=Phlebiopsis gigantea (strain 11061_1 CR5-6) TaxID=745531 RepID=A0A0C3S5B4_PHLG1|nr:hypothetical protein PHLGIDRAFT_37433 [Phlebiopsis gigantea 11061_1 CR5-6]